MNPEGSKRVREVQDPIIPIVGEWTRDNPGTISLGQGVVCWGPPREVYDAIATFRENLDNHKYKLVQGIPELLEAIETKLSNDNNIQLNAQERVVVTAGANMGFMNAVFAITDPGDEIIIPVPYYFNHEMAIRIAGCTPVVVPTDDNHQPDPDQLASAITPKTRAIITISPNNPSGAVYPESTLRAINTLCEKHGIYHIADEAYEYFTYEGTPHFSPNSIPGSDDHTIGIYSLSKTYGFASWRIGYMVIPPKLLHSVKKIQDTNLICPPVISQYAATACLHAGISSICPHLNTLDAVRYNCLQQIHQLEGKVTFAPTRGAFYFLLKVDTQLPSIDLVRHLIENHKIATMPGSTFGLDNACFLRISYGALSQESVMKGIGRLVEGLRKLKE